MIDQRRKLRLVHKSGTFPNFRILGGRSGFGASLFKLLLSWRLDAHKGRSQTQLSNEYATLVEPFTQSSGKLKGGEHKSPSNDSTSASSAPNGDGAVTSGDRNGSDIARTRIRLQKSRRIVSERSA